MEKENICLQCEQKDIILDSGVCPHCDYLNRKNDYLQNDGNITITKDNIHLYYEFMSDEDKNIYHNLIWTLLVERYKFIIKTLSLCDFQVGVGFFKVKDVLKPIDEYIEEIKESSKYKEYIKNKQ